MKRKNSGYEGDVHWLAMAGLSEDFGGHVAWRTTGCS